MRAALVSLDQRWHDKDANFTRCVELARSAGRHGCELVIFPEMTLTGYTMDTAAVVESLSESPTLERFGRTAAEANLIIAFGACLADSSTGKPRNQFCLARPDGRSEAVYAKVHPFSYAGEDRVFEAGRTVAAFDVGDVRVSASICYDLRFPELYSALAARCSVIAVIANWPADRVSHWRTLLTARAIENQSFVLGVNRIGVDGNGLRYEKSTLAFGPDGSPLEPLSAQGELDVYEIDPAVATKYREGFPTLRDKRYGVYCDLFRTITC